MDMLDEDLLRFWISLNKHDVLYIMVGGFAVNLYEIEGIKIPFLHINQLIQNKKMVNRPKDQIDVAELEKIRQILAEGRH